MHVHVTGSEAPGPLESRLLCSVSWIPTNGVAAQLGAIFEEADRKLSETIMDEADVSRCEPTIPGWRFLSARCAVMLVLHPDPLLCVQAFICCVLVIPTYAPA